MLFENRIQKVLHRVATAGIALAICSILVSLYAFDLGPIETAAAEEKGIVGCQVNCPNDIVITVQSCDASSGVGFPDPTFQGDCPRNMGFTYVPPPSEPLSGYFPVGTTKVVCTTDEGQTCSFKVIIKTSDDSTPPVLTCPGNIVKKAKLGTGGAKVTYAPEATDNCSKRFVYDLLAGLPSGANFPVGTTTNTVEVADASGNTDQCSFDVTVVPSIGVKQPSDTTVFQGFKTPVRWKSGGTPGDVRIELRRDGAFVKIIKIATADDGLLRWEVPQNLPTGPGYTIRVSSVDDPTIFDESAKPFRVKSVG